MSDERSSIAYRLLGYWVRKDACALAARALRATDVADGYAPRIWSLAVFFERYLLFGAGETADAFGPKDPTPLRPVSDSSAMPAETNGSGMTKDPTP